MALVWDLIKTYNSLATTDKEKYTRLVCWLLGTKDEPFNKENPEEDDDQAKTRTIHAASYQHLRDSVWHTNGFAMVASGYVPASLFFEFDP